MEKLAGDVVPNVAQLPYHSLANRKTSLIKRIMWSNKDDVVWMLLQSTTCNLHRLLPVAVMVRVAGACLQSSDIYGVQA